MTTFIANGVPVDVRAEADKPLLWVLREDLGLLGPKYGCGIAQCGACRVLIDGVSTPSCMVPLAEAEGRSVVTVEGLPDDDGALSIIQQAWIAEQVPQCGFCQPGFLISATALLAGNRQPTDADIDASVTNICRCGTYPRIRKAIHRAAAQMRS